MELEPLFVWDSLDEMVAEINRLEAQYQRSKTLPMQEDFSSGYVLVAGDNDLPPDQVVVGEILSWEQYRDEFVMPEIMAGDGSIEDLPEGERLFNKLETEAYSFMVKLYFRNDKVHARPYERRQLLPITKEQFEQIRATGFNPGPVQELGWFKSLLRDWSVQAAAEHGASTPPCPHCGAKGLIGTVISVRMWTGLVVEHDNCYQMAPPDHSMMDAGDLKMLDLKCLVCNEEIEVKEMPIEVVSKPHNVL